VAELAARKHQHVEEARLTGEETDAAIRALRAQLRDAREQHERSAAEAEALLGEQEELSRRYRHEATELAQRSEGLVVELRSEVERLALRNAELSAQLAATTTAANQMRGAEQASSERTRAVDAELRAARQELSRLRGAEAQHRATAHAWAYERKQLLRQVQRSHLIAEAAARGEAPPRFVSAPPPTAPELSSPGPKARLDAGDGCDGRTRQVLRDVRAASRLDSAVLYP